jgi:co-chaperonin GroES (HSP10)
MPNQIIKVSQEDFDSLHLINNNVAVEITHRNNDEKTKSGIVLINDPNFFSVRDIKTAETYDTSQHLDRWGVVAKIPNRLIYAKDKRRFGMDWDTDIEIKVGDLVWADYYNLHHCPVFRVINGEEFKDYWIVTYDCLIVAKRITYKDMFNSFVRDGDISAKIIPLNGFCLFEQVNEGLKSSFLELPKEINKSKGVVKYVGSRNREYNTPKYFDDFEILPGQEVIFRTEAECLLENEQHQYFENTNLRYEQRKNILGIKKSVPSN